MSMEQEEELGLSKRRTRRSDEEEHKGAWRRSKEEGLRARPHQGAASGPLRSARPSAECMELAPGPLGPRSRRRRAARGRRRPPAARARARAWNQRRRAGTPTRRPARPRQRQRTPRGDFHLTGGPNRHWWAFGGGAGTPSCGAALRLRMTQR
jgi:hypothetical protein